MTATITPALNATTSTRDFLHHLTDQDAKSLVFEIDGQHIRSGYHVTEVKAASYETMDCGGQGNLWHETIVQLMPSPSEEHEGHMKVKKFLSIYTQVAAQIPVRANAEIKIEYGDDGSPAIQCRVGGVQSEGDTVVVRLEPPRVTCKANDRKAAMAELTMLEAGSSCCGPSDATQSAAASKCC